MQRMYSKKVYIILFLLPALIPVSYTHLTLPTKA